MEPPSIWDLLGMARENMTYIIEVVANLINLANTSFNELAIEPN